ncbi:MAG TPA: response regulator, partial [Acidimicrobiia bacterium]|nr:response regulator [Acidimicrobiia bacterium]
MSERVLIADDDPDILAVVQVNFELEGLEVETAVDGEDALQKATANPPNVIVLDIMMPRMDGLTALHRLRSQASTGNIPIILLTARGLPEDRVRGLELGADDYITKPFDINELVARVRAVVRRTQAARDLSPLTGLPGNFKITAEIEERITSGRDYALVHGDLDNFKAFNDHYGFMRGDEVIRFCAKCFRDASESLGITGAFVGHIGGDDFVAIIPPEMAESFCKEVIERFDDGILDLYDTADA